MKSITYNGMTYHLPFSETFRRHTPEELNDMRKSISHDGVRNAILLYHDTMHALPKCVLDGEGRLRIAAELGLPNEQVPMIDLGEMTTDEAYEKAQIYNDHRRQDSPEAVRRRRAERNAKMGKLRENGLSTRAIAGEVGVNHSTVVRSLSGGGASAPLAKVNGLDGKQYPSRRMPKHFRPGYNGDPNHKYAAILNLLSHISRLITIAINEPGGEKLKAYLSYHRMIEHRDFIIDGKKYKSRFIGFRALRRLIKLAGLPGKLKTEAELKAECARQDEEADH